MRFLLTLPVVLFSFLLLFLPPQVSAESKNYKTAYHVVYDVKENGMTHTTMRIGLTNLTSKYYASSYKLHIGFADIKNIRASDKEGAITPILKKLEEGYSVELLFNDKVVGIGNTMQFTLSFDISSVAKNREGVWEISIPAIANQEAFSDFTVEVKPPPTFGIPSVIKPQTKDGSLKFSKKELGKSGISILFGQNQQYHYDLTYHLKNNNVFPIQTEIALPPSTNYQESILEEIQPKPSNILLDKDGNWLAQYSLSPSEKRDIRVKGKILLSLQPKKVTLSEEERILYTKEQPYWQFSQEIQDLAKKLRTPKNIYDYTVSTLSYDYERRTSTSKTRIGAKGILNNPTAAVCLEFTDLFITLARAAGIPAREVDGYAHTDNASDRPLSLIPDVLHAWPEYYDFEKGTWIMVDPTWGDTTLGHDYFASLDLDHVTFVRRGVDSTYPIPAGGYKLSDQNIQNDVSITFTKDTIFPNQNLSFSSSIDEVVLSGFPLKGSLRVSNIGYGLSTEQSVNVSSSTLTPNTQVLTIPPIPPGGTRSIAVSFDKTPFLTKETHTFTIELAGKKIIEEVSVTPLLITKWHILGGIFIAVLSLIILIVTRKAGRLPFLRR